MLKNLLAILIAASTAGSLALAQDEGDAPESFIDRDKARILNDLEAVGLKDATRSRELLTGQALETVKANFKIATKLEGVFEINIATADGGLAQFTRAGDVLVLTDEELPPETNGIVSLKGVVIFSAESDESESDSENAAARQMERGEITLIRRDGST